MQAEAYQAFIEQLTVNLQGEDAVRGLVLLGSTADQSHAPDEWSDHDFFVITDSGLQEIYRTRFDWLPDHEQIVLTVRETAHGLKVLYRSGHILEYAVFDHDEIGLAKANDYAIPFDDGGIAEAMSQIAVQAESAAYTPDAARHDLDMALCLLVVGAGRVARGEGISGQVFIRSHALAHLLTMLTHHLPAEDRSQLDNLDVFRRFERVFPDVGAEINTALARPPLETALGLLAVIEAHLSDVDGYSAEAVATVREVLGRAGVG